MPMRRNLTVESRGASDESLFKEMWCRGPESNAYEEYEEAARGRDSLGTTSGRCR